MRMKRSIPMHSLVAGQQLPISPIAHSTLYQPMRKSVPGFLISPFGRNSFYGVSNQP
ncbi:hypothetical protein D9M69_441790 [compost metagenome]